MPARIKEADRVAHFWSRVDKSGECWLWTGGKNPGGYGYHSVGRVPIGAHRYAYEITYGPIPSGMVVRHTCDTRLCCRPGHLRAGSQLENMRDAVVRGRTQRGERHRFAKLNVEAVRSIRNLYDGSLGQMRDLARRFGVSGSAIELVIHGKNWVDVPATPPTLPELREMVEMLWACLDCSPEGSGFVAQAFAQQAADLACRAKKYAHKGE